MFPNPFLSLLLALAIYAAGFATGHRWATNADLAAVAEPAQQAVERASQSVEVENRDAAASAKANAHAQAHTRRAKVRGQQDAYLKAVPVCARDDKSHRLLIDAIDIANTPTRQLQLSDELRTPEQTDQPE